MYCDHHAIPNYQMDQNLALGVQYGAMGPQKSPKNQLLCLWCSKLKLFRAYYFMMLKIIRLVQKYYWGHYESSKGAPIVQFM